MMKTVQAAVLCLMMMMMVGSGSAGPLPPSLDDSRDATMNGEVNSEENTAMNAPENATTNATTNATIDPFKRNFYPLGCILPTCLTLNLGSSLQSGDEKAGSATTDPHGIGRK